jgi:hypothetical protein
LLLAALASGAAGFRGGPPLATLGSVSRQGTKLTLEMPSAAVFTERQPALVAVRVESGLVPPAEGKDVSLVLSADASNVLHLHTASQVPDKQWVPLAWASYKNTVAQNGWGYLSVKATEDDKISDELKSYAAGFVEGIATAKQIKEFQHNAHALMAKDETSHQAIGSIRDLFNKELKNIHKMSSLVEGKSTAAPAAKSGSTVNAKVWKHAKFMTLQAWGIVDAYNQHVDQVHGTPMSMVDMMILNSDGETPELEKAYDFQEVLLRQANREGGDDNITDDAFVQTGRVRRHSHMGAINNLRGRTRREHAIGTSERRPAPEMDDRAWRTFRAHYGRCSALVRLTENNSDIFVGHTTFSDYSEMNRIFKFYDLPLEGGASRRMSFSSYPGVIGSTDDYYIMDTGVVVTETTVSMMSDEAFDNLDDNGTYIPDYMRIMIANRLARTATEWVDYMKSTATGTYNSQWMVVDYNLFKPGQPLKNGTFWVLEQAPGVSHGEDMSARLQSTGFWASENRGFFGDVRNVSGEADAEDINGEIFSEAHNPRANIFAKTAPTVQSLADMRAEMQRNKWPNEVDGGIANTPDHAIAARGDLSKDRPDPNGGVDSKVTNSCLVKSLAADAICGPTHDGLPAFRWVDDKGKELYPEYPHDGLPNLWNFDWVRFTPDGEMPKPHDECSTK